jgi:hypothetical protein
VGEEVVGCPVDAEEPCDSVRVSYRRVEVKENAKYVPHTEKDDNDGDVAVGHWIPRQW